MHRELNDEGEATIMANKRMGQVTVTGEWARHLRPILRRAFWKGERSAVKAAVRAELHGNADAARSPDASESSPLRTYRGSCHCGAVQFEIATDAPELTTCDCSICRRKNALMVKVHESRFRLIAGEASLREYRPYRYGAPLLLQGVRHLPLPSQARDARFPGHQRVLPRGLRPLRHSRARDARIVHGMNVGQLKRYCRALPGAVETDHGEPYNFLVYAVRGRKFAYFKTSEPERWRFSTRVTPDRFVELTEVPGVKPARYRGRYGWITIVDVAAFPEGYLRELVAWSHRRASCSRTRIA